MIPDTGFTVQLIGAFLEQVRASGSNLFANLLPALEDLCRRALHGLLTGGLHTPKSSVGGDWRTDAGPQALPRSRGGSCGGSLHRGRY